MDYPTNFEDYSTDIEETGLFRKDVGAASLETTIRQPILFFICLPFTIFGVISNVLVLWIWLSVKTKFDDMMYLFRALAVADFFFLVNHPFARFYLFHNIHIKTFFRIISYGSRPISVQITLMLAIARFIRMFYPLRAQKILSHPRLKFCTMLIVFCNLSMETILTTTMFSLPEKQSQYAFAVVKKGIMLSVPTMLQNVLMLFVVLKLMRFSKVVTPSYDANVSQQSEQGQAMSEQENQVKQAHKSETSSSAQTAQLLEIDHRETACNAGPQDPLTPVDTEETAQSDQTAGGQLKTNQENVVFEAELLIQQQRDPLLESEPHTAKQGHSAHAQEPCPVDNKSIPLQRVSISSKGQTGIDHGTVYVVLAICVCTFVAGMFCSVVKIIFFHLKLYETPSWSYACNVVIIINHSINVVFYLFISSFRQTLLSKCRRLTDTVRSFSSISLKATYPSLGRGGTTLDSKKQTQSRISSGQEPSSTKYVACSIKDRPSGLRQ